jgi:hypothetical protein
VTTPPRSGWSLFWHLIGVVLTVVVVICGLAGVAWFVFLAIAMNSYGSNK